MPEESRWFAPILKRQGGSMESERDDSLIEQNQEDKVDVD